MEQPGLLFDEAAKYGRFVFLCGDLIADDPQRPTWNKGDFFGDRYKKETRWPAGNQPSSPSW